MNAPPAALLDARYQVGPVLARGGMSTVYRGTDTRLDRPVAIKVMESRLASDPAFRARFEREARSAARIDHPAVVDVHDQGDHMGVDGPVLFLVMELVDGGTLRDVLEARGALGVPAALAVMEPVLAGLAEAHRLGLVHRDVKPENVLISYTGEVKVADFGLVTAAAQAGASHAGYILGTVNYLSPEQVTTGAADSRSDVYAAGVLLYELLTGAPPFSGDTALSVAYRHVNTDVPAPSLIAGDVPPELDELVLRATRRDPDARPPDAAAMLAELRRVAVQLEVPRVPPPVPPPRSLEDQDTLPAIPQHVPSGSGAALPPGAGKRTGTRMMPRSDEAEHLATPGGAPPHLRARRRSRRIFAIWVAVVLVLALLVGVTAWWLGSGRWTAMPSLVGLQQATAQQLLSESDLVASIKTARDNTQPEGAITATDPQPDARLLRGSIVVITVSSGRPTVPAVAPGTAVAAAEQALRDGDLNPVRSTDADQFSDTVPAGAVVSTNPAAGTALPIGAPVTLVISRGPEPPDEDQVEVPFVIGERYDDASDKLDDVGLDSDQHSRFSDERGRSRVIGQDPSAGTLVDKGSTVTLETF
ncbi:Stk1 family PASTA domain-containing Ser/Thr kinase [Pseudonocardia alaniniphila]|uniref:non-specific serine/threonine protein kinase n=1 Tax=Pseudonocardia alaniniphila TaxID=75291 RepID=A0ABS9TJS7_9PSEU|nr:Stk1 family PASTA domain-containing Ser/Thr kinase [Pseudonocardia alaniniphila]MCH6168804.1 Stk1 family PASTA domain-containing Ser/Thr kinase [Pseudonocardia alaniniphila]